MKTQRITSIGVTVTIAMIMSYLETLVPLNFAVPGIKMGLANLVIIFVLYRRSFGDACIVSLMRVLLVALLFGNAMSLIYSVSGAVLSLLLMRLMMMTERFSPVGVSVTGAVMHNVGQIIAAIFILGSSRIAYYLPVLLVSGIVTGTVIGIVAARLIRRIPANVL